VTGTSAYVDESERRGRYLMCAVVIDPVRAGKFRREIRGLLLPGQRRLHFKKEGVRRRRELATALLGLQLDASVFVCRAAPGRGEAEARALCLAAVVRHLQSRGEPVSLILESRHHQDVDDQPVIAAARRREPPLSYEHVDGDHEPLLWLPDSFAWLVGAGSDWRRRVAPAISRFEEVG
jgi:hypothetical protein